jgi:small nuclear ribonucleoprotein (snRNP)-like protein
MIQLTIFKNLYDNKTEKGMTLKSFDDFENLLISLSSEKKKSKKDSNLISPACYLEGTDKRRNDNVTYWGGWGAMDVDDHDFDPNNLEEQLKDRYGKYRYVVYSTASSTLEKPKFRLIFALTENVLVNDIKPFWYALNQKIEKIGDEQTKDLSRMYYIPAQYEGANNFIFSNQGDYLDPKTLIKEFPYPFDVVDPKKGFVDRLPESIKERVYEYKKNTLTKKDDVVWSSYRNCPFVNQKLIENYRNISGVDNSGRYAMIYKIIVSIALSAIKNQYAIDSYQIIDLIRELDAETGNRYKKRKLEVEVDRALEYAYKNIGN